MYCPDEKIEVELSEGSPMVNRLRINGKTVFGDVEISDLCDSCARPLFEAKFKVERGLADIGDLQGHFDHKLSAQLLTVERLHDSPGFGSVKLFYGLTCSCEKLKMFKGLVFGSGIMMPKP